MAPGPHDMCTPSIVWRLLYYYSADARAHRARGTVQGALHRLRQSQGEIAGSIEAKRRRIRDFDGKILEIGLRRRVRSNGAANAKKVPLLSEEDRAALVNELRRKRLYNIRIQRFYGLLSTVEQQIATLEDASTLHTSLTAIQTGSTAHGSLSSCMKPEDVEQLLETVTEQQALAVDTTQLMADTAKANELMQGLDDASLEDELATLMDSEEFMGQFDPNDVTRARQAYQDAIAAPPDPNAPLIHATESMVRRTRGGMMLLPDTL